MTSEKTYNDLPEGFEGEQQRRTEFDSAEEKSSHDADGLIALAKKTYRKEIVTVNDTFDLRSRKDGNPEDLRRAVAMKLKNPEQVEIDGRLQPLVIDPINALPEDKRTVQGRVYSGEEIARAIPNVEAFLEAISQRKEGQFFELNEAGQLVMADGCSEAYGLKDDFPMAKIRQTRVYYHGEDGSIQVMEGQEWFTVKEEGGAKELELSEAAKKISPESITMVSGLPTLKRDGNSHTGEYARMNTGQFERKTYTWTDDDSLDASRARLADWPGYREDVHSNVNRSNYQYDYLGSRGVLRVNLNLES